MLQGGLAVCLTHSSHSVTDHPTTGEVSVQTEEKQNDPQILLPQCLCSLKLSTEINKNNPQSALQRFLHLLFWRPAFLGGRGKLKENKPS